MSTSINHHSDVSYIRFSLILIASMIVAFITGIDFPGMGLFIAVFAVLDAGSQYYKKVDVLPSSNVAWSITFRMSLIEFCVGVIAILVFFRETVHFLYLKLDLPTLGLLFLVFIFFFLLAWVIKRCLFMVAAKHVGKNTR